MTNTQVKKSQRKWKVITETASCNNNINNTFNNKLMAIPEDGHILPCYLENCNNVLCVMHSMSHPENVDKTQPQSSRSEEPGPKMFY